MAEQKQRPIGDPMTTGPISGGGPGGRGGGGQFSLPKQPAYEIWSRRLGKKVGEVTSREGATRAVDRRDIDYGGADHYWKKIGD